VSNIQGFMANTGKSEF